MQKKLLAAAVAGALASPLAFAQSSVTIYGAIDMSLHNYRVSGGNAGNVVGSMNKWDVYNQSSRIGFRGEEGLGGGLRAWFQSESNLAFDGRQNFTGSVNLSSRNTGVGLTGGWGTVMLGQWDSPMKVAIIGATATGTTGGLSGHNAAIFGNGNSNGSAAGDTTGSNPNLNCDGPTAAAGTIQTTTPVCGLTEGGATSFHRRLSNVVQYWSPKFGGFDFRVAMTANEEKSAINAPGFNNNPRLWAASGTYAAGPISAVVAYEHHRGFRDTATTISTINTKDRSWLLGAGYNFGIANVQIAYQNYKFGNALQGGSDNGYKRRDWFVGAAFPIGPAGSAIRAGYSWTPGARSCGGGIAATSCGSASKARAMTLGYDHALSKRSSVYIAYGAVRNNEGAVYNFNAAPTGSNGFQNNLSSGQDSRTLGVGIKHTF